MLCLFNEGFFDRKSRPFMKTRTNSAMVLLSAVCAVTAVTVNASDPLGVYAVVQKVVLEPNDAEPLRVQIWGAFSLWEANSGDEYEAPRAGYLYYSCPQGEESTCRNEWSDIKSVAGKGLGIGFGGRYRAAGRIRKADEKPTGPDAYPIRMGVVRVGPRQGQPEIVTKLKALLAAR